MSKDTIVICPYCENQAELVMGDKIYPNSSHLHKRKYWLCIPCDAYVGTHENSSRNIPLGSLADRKLRKARIKAHGKFDPMWRFKFFDRSSAYRWLSKMLDIPIVDCHIGKMDEETCKRVIKICGGLL